MRVEYNEELRMIKDEILLMSAMTEKMLSDSVAALKSQDCELARSVIDRDDLVDGGVGEVHGGDVLAVALRKTAPVG